MNGDRFVATDISDHRAASALGILVLALVLAGCASAPSALPVGALPASPTVGPAPSVTPSATVPPRTPVATPAPTTGLASTPIATAIPVADSSPTPTAAPTPSSCVALGAYTVVVGDTLWDIARDKGVSLASLLAMNPQIGDRSLIRVGDPITIPPRISELEVPGGPWSQATDINDRGQVVGGAGIWHDGVLTAIGTLEGDDSSHAWAINERGQVIGESVGRGARYRPFLWEDGVITALEPGALEGGTAFAMSINDRGQVVGYLGVTHNRAVLWQDGVMTDLGTLGGARAVAHGINNRGQIAGASETSSGEWHAFLWQDGVMSDLGAIGTPLDINERGQIVGWRETDVGWESAFLWDNGVVTDLGSLGGVSTRARAINERGQIVGESESASGMAHAFLWQDEVMIDLGTLEGDVYSSATAINDCGQIVGSSAHMVDDYGEMQAAIWTP